MIKSLYQLKDNARNMHKVTKVLKIIKKSRQNQTKKIL